MGQKYTNPPIIEAACEFRLPPDTTWDPTIPGAIYDKVRTEFPHKGQRLVQEVEMREDPQGTQHQLRVRATQDALFSSTDKKMSILVGPHLLSVNCSKPYPTWEGFKPKIVKAFGALTDCVDFKELQRIGLRYINRIEIPEQSVKLEDYLELRPFLGARLPQSMADFVLECMLSLADGRDYCKVQLTNAVPEKPNSTAFLLDLDYALAPLKTISTNHALEWIGAAHQQVEGIFEGCITDRLRKRLLEPK